MSGYLPLHRKTPRPVPPLRNHLPIDAVAHKTIPFTHWLSRMPMINSHISKKAFFSGQTEHASGRIASALCVRSSRISRAFCAFHFLRLVHPDAPPSLPSVRRACCSPTPTCFLPLGSALLSCRLLASCLLRAVARIWRRSLLRSHLWRPRSVRFHPLPSAAILRSFFLSLHPTVISIIPLLFTRRPARPPCRPPTLVGFPSHRRA